MPLPLFLYNLTLFSLILATDDEMTIHFEISGKKSSFCINAQYLHNENLFHPMFTTCACDDIEGTEVTK